MTFFDRGEEMVFEDAFQLNTLWPNLIFGPQSPFKWKCSPSCALGTKPGVWPPCAVSLCSPPRPSFLPDYLLSWFLSFQKKSEKRVHFSMLDQHYVKFSAFHGDQNEWIGGVYLFVEHSEWNKSRAGKKTPKHLDLALVLSVKSV